MVILTIIYIGQGKMTRLANELSIQVISVNSGPLCFENWPSKLSAEKKLRSQARRKWECGGLEKITGRDALHPLEDQAVFLLIKIFEGTINEEWWPFFACQFFYDKCWVFSYTPEKMHPCWKCVPTCLWEAEIEDEVIFRSLIFKKWKFSLMWCPFEIA